ncbi:ABC transporter permease [Saliniramus fredricksonii]|uniref:Peptide/nickel transport system permease protein n=1 Tax=Saliniramus fredricksonii TaxID=1653334 RepID=A0ABY0K9I7_9HYPH|nr:ABC transporter permease [Saliniramus fredricksonii]SCC81149.1 peptide/nickel transport system permease protein [Saliniramus fredricksonii]
MTGFMVRRLIAMPLLLLGVATLAFFLTHVTKADPLSAVVSERQMNNPAVVAAAKARWGLDRPLPEQYVVYISNLAQGELGTSFRTRRPVSDDIFARLPATLELVLFAMVFGVFGGVWLGIAAAHWRDSVIDHTARLFALIGSSMPVFWTGLILLYVFSVALGWLPGPGRIDPRIASPAAVTGFYTVDSLIAGDLERLQVSIAHLLLPAFVLGWAVMGIISRLVRGSMLDVLEQDYIRTARAKGAGEPRVLVRHALRNALIPTLTIIGHSFAYLITGAVLTETIFSWPGIGSYAVDSARSLDHPAIIGVTLIGATAFLLANLVTDILYAVFNPRIQLGRGDA